MKCKICFIMMGICVVSIMILAYPTDPPQPLHRVGDHWTPYDPPLEIPEDVETYIIQPGDTLWNLAEIHLGNPFLWPQIWENNTYITDSHWIYPGDPLILSPVEVEEVVQEQGYQEQPYVEEEPGESRIVESERKRVLTPVPLGTTSDMMCFAKVFPTDQEFPLEILGTDDAKLKYTLSEGQIVYINGGTAEGVEPGSEFFIAHDHGIIKDEEGIDLGRVWLLGGKLAILCAQEHTSTARITMACRSILRGNHLIPFEIVPIPTVLPASFDTICQESTGKISGTLIMAKDDLYSISQGTNVLIGLGKADGVEPGNYVRVFREETEDGSDYVLLGRLGVLETFDHTSNCKVLESIQEIHRGDRVELE